jgi:AAA+ superfamily predicted ATPase
MASLFRSKNGKAATASATIINQIWAHMGCDATQCPVVSQSFQVYELPNVHIAIEELLGSDPRMKLLGVIVRDYEPTLARLVSPSSAHDFNSGPVEYKDTPVGDGELACVTRGVYLFHDAAGEPLTMLFMLEDTYRTRLHVEVMARERPMAERFTRKLADRVRLGKAYRGKVFSLEQDCFGATSVKFHQLPPITRDDIILPQKLLERIERHTVSFARQAERLKACGRHLKRGILLHGPPGTGKTLSATYLASRMEGRTVIVLTGAGIQAIEAACHLARLLQPTTVILEDVDLIGTEREHQTVGANALLFELLNQMDGLGADCDVLFILTTNRPDVLEPALASRPGRIDQALEVPLPDAECRQRLIELYGQGLTLEVQDMDGLVAKLKGTSAAFIRELLRKGALLSAEEEEGDSITVNDRHLDEALAELVVAGGALTQKLLGAESQKEIE